MCFLSCIILIYFWWKKEIIIGGAWKDEIQRTLEEMKAGKEPGLDRCHAVSGEGRNGYNGLTWATA